MSAKKNVVLVVVLVMGAIAAVAYLLRPSSLRSAALAGRQRAMQMLGERITKLRPESKVLVLSNPFIKESGYFDEKNQYEQAGLHGLRKGLGGRSTVSVVFPEIRPEYLANPQSVIIPPDFRTPLSFLIRPASVDQLAEAHPECRVIVSLIGLPIGVDQLKIWNEKDPRCFALLLPDLTMLGPSAKVIEAFQREKLLVAVVDDLQSGGFLIVTRDNIGEILKRQPKSLGY